ncbi:hypothetical protein DFH06DRAFT_1134131 [Mycena polygramma]|nr:hypothetical protein DFH06DRAFT_1134131 [Mycena polygramma]
MPPPRVDDSDSDSGSEHPPTKAARRSRDDVSGNETLPTRTRGQESRKPSEKVSTQNKENLESLQERLRKSEKARLKLKKKGLESEERSDEDAAAGFSSSIKVLGRLPVAPRPTKTPVVRKTKKGVASDTPRISSTAFKHLPELARDEPDSDGEERIQPQTPQSHPPLSSPQLHTPGARAQAAAGEKRRHDDRSSPLPQPPAKRPKHKVKEPKFCEGFVAVSGHKPKAADYAPVVEALILRSCAEYSCRIMTINPFPPPPLQYQWAKECFTNSCRSAKVRYGITDRMVKVITYRGSEIRGKNVGAYRHTFETHFKFTAGNSKAAAAANKAKVTELTHKASFHYKDPKSRTGYAQNSIIAVARKKLIFKDRKSLAAIFPTYFNPISGSYLALDFSVLQFLAEEYSTGKPIAGSFTEKEMSVVYRTHLADVTDKWIKSNPIVTENLRHKWYKRASQHYISPEPLKESYIDDDDVDILRLEMEGRTGDTDSEEEVEVEGEGE